MNQKSTKIFYGKNENRYITQFTINENTLKNILNTTTITSKKISFNLMLMTTDHKVLLLERTQSFHFPKVIKDLKIGSINFGMIESLYPVEMEKIRKIFFDFIPPQKVQKTSTVFLFPGGHLKSKETIALTLFRELYEETGYAIDFKNIRFNQSCLFKVLIHDLLIKKTFNNFIFPVKVDISSNEIINKFKNTKHTRNPTFIDIQKCNSLFDAFIKVQEYMLL